jgi:toxin ParE1/3/4
MTVKGEAWTVRLSTAAETDLQNILEWTLAQFGAAQVRNYAKTLSAALETLTDGPAIIGAKARDDIANGLFTLHVARQGRKGRHFLLFRLGKGEEKKVIEVLRILHDAMDLPRHVPP